VIPSNFRQAAAVLHTRVDSKDPVGISDRHVFFSDAGFISACPPGGTA
jgi:hypothetical protein